MAKAVSLIREVLSSAGRQESTQIRSMVDRWNVFAVAKSHGEFFHLHFDIFSESSSIFKFSIHYQQHIAEFGIDHKLNSLNMSLADETDQVMLFDVLLVLSSLFSLILLLLLHS